MARRKGANSKKLQVREQLENALAALADHQLCGPDVLLRVRQAIRRAGLDALLGPAVDDIERMVQDVTDAKSQVSDAARKLME
jgi:hypothetical protein